MQLVHDDDDRVVLWDSMRDRVYGPREVREKFGVPPSQVRDFLALTGDTSDNVPGRARASGPKTAARSARPVRLASTASTRTSTQVTKPKLRESLADPRGRRAHLAEARHAGRDVADRVGPVRSCSGAARTYRSSGASTRSSSFIVSSTSSTGGSIEARRSRRGGDRRSGGSALGESTPRAGPPGRGDRATAPSRVYEVVLDAASLERVVAQARERGQVGVAAAVTSDDAMRAEILGVSLSIEPGRGYYVPLAHRYLGCAEAARVERRESDPRAPARGPGRLEGGLRRQASGDRLRARGRAASRAPRSTSSSARTCSIPRRPNALKELARRELGVRTLRRRVRGGPPKTRGPQPLFDEIDVERAARLRGARGRAAGRAREHGSSRGSEAERLDGLMRDVEVPLEARARRDGNAGRARRRADAREDRAEGRGDAARARGRVQEDRRPRLPRCDRATSSRRSSSTSCACRSSSARRRAGAPRTPTCSRRSPTSTSCRSGSLEFRELDKLKGTYIDALPRYVNPATGRIHTRFDQAVAATGRLSSSDPNLQNIPIRTEMGRAIRAAFVAPPGHVILSADYSQIELRVLAHLVAGPRARRRVRERARTCTRAPRRSIFDKPRGRR